MPTERSDPACPACREPVGARASYCMHCGAEFDHPAEGADATTSTLTDADAAADVDYDAPSLATETPPDPDDGTASSDGDAADGGGLLHPDGLADNTLTVGVGVVAGFLIGLVAVFALSSLLSGLGGSLGVLVWLGATGYLVRRRTVVDAVYRGAYGLAVALVVGPLAVVLSTEGDLAGRVIAYLIFAVPLGVVAAVLAGVGYLAGRRRSG